VESGSTPLGRVLGFEVTTDFLTTIDEKTSPSSRRPGRRSRRRFDNINGVHAAAMTADDTSAALPTERGGCAAAQSTPANLS
jgi:hypothetical protein